MILALRLLLLILGLTGIATAAVGLRPVRDESLEPLAGSPGAPATGPRAGGARSRVTYIKAPTPFRLSRQTPMVRFGEQPPAPAPPPALRPVLQLTGILFGREPAALIEGIPGLEGAVVLRRGDSVAGFHLRRLDESRAIVTGLDTTWVLTVREPWR